MVLIVILTVCLILVCMCLVGLILIQQGKGGGLVALGGSGVDQAFGTHAASMAQKATALLAVVFLVLVIVLGLLHRDTMVRRVPAGDTPAGEGIPAESSSGDSGVPAGEG